MGYLIMKKTRGRKSHATVPLKRGFFNCREYLFGKNVECTLCRKNQNTTSFWPEGAPGDPCMKQFSERKKQGTLSITGT